MNHHLAQSILLSAFAGILLWEALILPALRDVRRAHRRRKAWRANGPRRFWLVLAIACAILSACGDGITGPDPQCQTGTDGTLACPLVAHKGPCTIQLPSGSTSCTKGARK